MSIVEINPCGDQAAGMTTKETKMSSEMTTPDPWDTVQPGEAPPEFTTPCPPTTDDLCPKVLEEPVTGTPVGCVRDRGHAGQHVASGIRVVYAVG